MNRRIIITGDGSNTLFVPELNEHYHSIHGAIQESLHVFIGNGLQRIEKNSISILEAGFGTGLNALLTFGIREKKKEPIYYESWERYPLHAAEYDSLNYPAQTGGDARLYRSIVEAPWNQVHEIFQGGTLKKVEGDIRNFSSDRFFDLVYFDAFGPDIQPDLWTTQVFSLIAARQLPGSVLTTYSVKGIVRRNLAEAGYQVEKVPGPAGKREITLAVKR